MNGIYKSMTIHMNQISRYLVKIISKMTIKNIEYFCALCHGKLDYLKNMDMCYCQLMFTDERIHAYCSNDIRKLVQIPNSSQVVLNDYNDYVQNQLNEGIINLFTSYFNNLRTV